MSQEIATPPAGVGIKVVESSNDRLVIAIPPGGQRARGIGCFGVMWLTIIGIITFVFLFMDDVDWDGDAPPLIVLIPFLGLFWAVGIGMLVAWARMSFTQIYLAVTPEQFAIQKTLFGRKKLTKLVLDQSSHAELIESYTENDTPVYAIQMAGVGDSEKFATGLSYEEKRWLATTINQFLGRDGTSTGGETDTRSLPEYCSDCGTRLMIGDGKRVCPDCARVYVEVDAADDREPRSRRDFSSSTDPRGDQAAITERPPAIAPYELPDDSRIRIDFDDGETLEFSYSIQVPKIVKIVGGVFLSLFCCAWYGFITVFFVMVMSGDEPVAAKVGIALFGSLFLFGGLMPLGALLALFLGRATINISPEKVIGSIGVLFLRKKKSISTESITDLGLAPATISSRRRGRQRSLGSASGYTGCVLESSEFNMPLSMGAERSFNQQVAGLARFQLDRLGVELPHD
ncbi:MAG: TraR/DksA C4-type zinc finger protein [Planctomycetota bacterium]|nr:TraR/DksA C4-type zinc finger protein [Planctomycetota bacterium]